LKNTDNFEYSIDKKNRWEDLDQYCDKITYTPSWNYHLSKRPTVTLHKTKSELEENQSTSFAGRQKRKEMRQKLSQNATSHRKSHRPPNTKETSETPIQDIVQGSPNISEDDDEEDSSSSLSDKPTGVNITIKTNRDHPLLNAVTQCTYYRKEREYKKKGNKEIKLSEYK